MTALLDTADVSALLHLLAGRVDPADVIPALERLQAAGRVQRTQTGDRLARWEAV